MLIHPQKSLGDDGFNHMHFVHVKPLDELNHENNWEKIYLQGNLAGRRRADEASSAQYLR